MKHSVNFNLFQQDFSAKTDWADLLFIWSDATLQLVNNNVMLQRGYNFLNQTNMFVTAGLKNDS